MSWTSYFLGVASALAPSVFFLGVIFGVACWKERHGRRRAIRQVLREVRQEITGR